MLKSIVEINKKDIQGNPKGKFLFTVVTIDTDDHEDSSTSLWRANSEDELFDLVKANYAGDEEDIGFEEISEQFESDWGFEILFTKIGKFK